MGKNIRLRAGCYKRGPLAFERGEEREQEGFFLRLSADAPGGMGKTPERFQFQETGLKR